MAATCLPSALFASCCSSYCPEELVKQILGVDTLTNGKHIVEDIEAFDWHIETKYYTSDIHLCTTSDRTIGDEKFADSVQAFVLYFDPESKNSFDLTKAWLSYLKLINPAVQLLVCNRCDQNSVVDRLTVQNWCIDNEFELVELSPEDGSDSEDDFGETTGLKRIIQALHAHTWPNLELKDNPSICSPYMRQLMKEQSEAKAKENDSEFGDFVCSNSQISKDSTLHVDKISNEKGDNLLENVSHSTKNDSNQCLENKNEDCIKKKEEKQDNAKAKKRVEKPNKEEVIDSLLPMDDDKAIFEAVGSDDPDGESFEQLFEKFRFMKEKAETLPPDERKAYAEKVAVSFWKAIGGDEDEIDGITDSDDDLG